ncbi:hypothetical protein ABB07_33370 [Streptomyces incarnatus]|uniref:Aromatic ring-opening dioxygenase LigA n=1 Tax=Streptomyces incarnatus TaxID=665007 RepID=A0ABM5TUU0_9ACTN|nr:hypothetical protein [Streptomyces incarnatus]AKJ14776.1 hypothetical protein ABB07_33370 [Streptomyces incarnatus]
MRRWWKVTLAAAAVLALGGWICAPYVRDWWLVRTACDGALPSGPLRKLAAGGGHFTKADTTAHPRLGDYGCSLRFEGRGDATLVVRMTAYTGRDDQDAEFLFDFPRAGISRMYPMPQDLPGYVDQFGDLQFLVRCPDLGKDAMGRPRRMLVSADLGYATARTSHAVYETVVPLVNSASRHLGCGATPLTVPKGDAAPPDPDKGEDPVPVTEAAGTGCGWVAHAGLPRSAQWHVEPLVNDTAPAVRCDLDRAASPTSSEYLHLSAWYGDWSNRLVSDDGVRQALTATARCAGEAANFAVSAEQRIPGVGTAEQRRLLRAFAADQVERRGCTGLRMTG